MEWMVLITVMVGTFLGRLDQTIVNLALPKIIGDFRITVSAAGWIATAYILANAVLVPVWGKLGDTIGRKKIYVIGFVLFIFSSVLAGLAWSFNSMIVFRVLQAIAVSADYPTAMAIIAVTFPAGRKRAQALGIWSSVFAASAVLGPLIGGPLIDHFGWRSVFFINLPVGLIGLLMALTFIKESTSDRKTTSFDFGGAITLGVALSALVLVLDKGIDWGWLSLSSGLAYATVIIFGIIFYNIERGHSDPIIDLKFFKNSVFINTLANNFVIFMGLLGCIFLIPIFAQTFLGYNSTQTGYLFLPLAGALMIASPLGGAMTGRIKPSYIIFISTFVAAIGLYLFSHLDPKSTAIDIIIPFFIIALGMGFGMSQRTNIITSVVPKEEVGSASSVLALVRNIAGAFGIAFFGTLLTNTIKSNVLQFAKSAVVKITNPLIYNQASGLIILKAQISAYNTVFFVASIIVAVGAFLAFKINIKKEEEGEKIFIEA
jgi:DHA2 family multidrug resistance protein